MFLLIILLGGAAGAYWYYINYIQETPKAAFFKFVGNNNFENVLDIDVYYNMLDQMSRKSFLAETSADFTTTMKNDFTENIDSSKFDFALNVGVDRKNDKSLVDGKITYSSNDLFALKILSTKDSVGIASEDILDKYLASKKTDLDESISKTTGINTDISADVLDDTMKNVSSNKIEMDDEYKAKKANEYSESIYNLIPEDSVSIKEGIIATIDSEAINTNAYTLSLDKNKYQEIVKTVLEKLKNDDELLGKIVTGEEREVEEAQEETPKSISQINTITDIQTQTEIVEGETEEHESELEITTIPQTDLVREGETDEEVQETEELEVISEPETNLVDETSLDTTTIPAISLPVEEDADAEENDLFTDLAKALILGQKIDGTVQDLKDEISEELNKVSEIKDGITITIYVRQEEGKARETVKLVAELPGKSSLDVEYMGNSKFKVTILSPEKDEDGKEVSAGSSVEVERQTTDVNVKYNIQYSNIENKKVVSKIQVQLQTENSNPSKGYTNNAIIKYNNNEGDLKVNIKNEIKFQEDAISEELTEENAIFIDTLSEEEAQNLYEQVFEKIMSVYAEKLVSLTFIDNNSSNSVIQRPEVQAVDTAEKEEIKAKLIETVSIMMGDAQSRGEEFTIQNLVDLKVEGYEVSSIVSEDLAIIKINGYTFNIDKDFMLSD